MVPGPKAFGFPWVWISGLGGFGMELLDLDEDWLVLDQDRLITASVAPAVSIRQKTDFFAQLKRQIHNYWIRPKFIHLKFALLVTHLSQDEYAS